MLRKLQLAILLMLAVVSVAAAEERVVIRLQGDPTTASAWSVAQIHKTLGAQLQPIKHDDHTFSCVPLLALLKAGGANVDFKMQPGTDPKKKNVHMRQVVVARGRDGYTVAFSMAELLPDVGNRAVWVAVAEDGKPLSGDFSPLRLIVPGDSMASRALRGVESITVLDAGAAVP